MDLLKRLFREDAPEGPIEDPVDYPIYEPGRPLPEQKPVFRLTWPTTHEHQWTERRVTAIESTCSECNVVELRPNHRGVLKGQKRGLYGTQPNPRLAKLVVTPKGARRGSSPAMAKRNAEWKAYYEAGQSVESIADLYQMGSSTVYGVLKRAGVAMRGQKHQKNGLIDAGRDAEILRLRAEEFWTYEQIGKKYGISRERVRQVLEKMGADTHQLFEAKTRATAKKYQPPSCPKCHEQYGEETWLEHRSRVHPMQTPEQAERDRQISADYAAGMKTKDIRAKYNIEPSAISRAIERRGVPKRRQNSNFLHNRADIEARKAAILADVQAGMRAKDIGSKYNVSSALVNLFAKNAGVTVAGSKPRATDEEKALWAQDYQAGLSVHAVARKYHRSDILVSKHIRAAVR